MLFTPCALDRDSQSHELIHCNFYPAFTSRARKIRELKLHLQWRTLYPWLLTRPRDDPPRPVSVQICCLHGIRPHTSMASKRKTQDSTHESSKDYAPGSPGRESTSKKPRLSMSSATLAPSALQLATHKAADSSDTQAGVLGRVAASPCLKRFP